MYLVPGVSGLGGVCSRGVSALGECLLRGGGVVVSALGGVCSGGEGLLLGGGWCLPQCMLGYHTAPPPESRPHPCEQND